MIYLPVFGKDSEPHSSSRLIGFCSTMIVWTIFFITMMLIGSKKEAKVKYETVQIQLSPQDHYVPTIPEEFLNGKLASGQEDMQAAPEVEAPVTPVPPVKTASRPKPAPKTPSPVKNDPVKNNTSTNKNTVAQKSNTQSVENYASSVEDQMNAQLNGTKKAAVWDDSMFADTTNAVSNSNNKSTGMVNQDATFSGSAASSSKSSNTGAVSSSSSSSSSFNNAQASEDTKNALSNLMNTSASTTQGTDRGTATSTSLKSTKTGDGKNLVQMSDGTSRALIEPSVIAINFSAEASRSIVEDLEVQITFTVNENGYVFGTISISSEALLSEIVRKEIRSQINNWRFESAPNNSKAIFTLKMVKK